MSAQSPAGTIEERPWAGQGGQVLLAQAPWLLTAPVGAARGGEKKKKEKELRDLKYSPVLRRLQKCDFSISELSLQFLAALENSAASELLARCFSEPPLQWLQALPPVLFSP